MSYGKPTLRSTWLTFIAIFAMAVPYCMIHYGKPYLETNGAIVAGIVLGSLAMRTRSIYAGFLVHATVAVLNDILALTRKHALPELLSPGSSTRLIILPVLVSPISKPSRLFTLA